MSFSRQAPQYIAPADPKVLMKGVKDAQARIMKLQEENDLLRQRLTVVEGGGPDTGPGSADTMGKGPPPRPSRGTAPPASVYAQTDIEDKSFFVMDFGGRKGGMPGHMFPGAPPSMAPSMAPSMLAPSTIMENSRHPPLPRVASPSATENSVKAFHNPTFASSQQFTQQEASEWKQMYIETLKHLRATKEAIEKERQAASQWEHELRSLMVTNDTPPNSAPVSPQRSSAPTPPAPRPPTAPSAIATPAPTPSPASAPAAAQATVAAEVRSAPPPSAATPTQQLPHEVPADFLQKYQQLGLGTPAGMQQQQLPKASVPNVYVLDPLDHRAAPSKGPIVFDVRTGITYTESPSMRGRGKGRANTIDNGSFTAGVSNRGEALGKPKRHVEHTVSRTMLHASKAKNAAPWMRNLFSCVQIGEDAVK